MTGMRVLCTMLEQMQMPTDLKPRPVLRVPTVHHRMYIAWSFGNRSRRTSRSLSLKLSTPWRLRQLNWNGKGLVGVAKVTKLMERAS